MLAIMIIPIVGIVVALFFLGGVVVSRLMAKPEATASPTATIF